MVDLAAVLLDPRVVDPEPLVREVADDGRHAIAAVPALDELGQPLARALADEHEDLALAVAQQLLHEMAADEARGPGDEVGHVVSSPAVGTQPIRRHRLRRAPRRPRNGPPRPRRRRTPLGAPEADDARQPLRPAVDERHAPAALGEAERGARGGDAQVAPERELEAPGQAPAADGGDGWLGRRAPGEAHRAVGVVQPRGVGLDRLEVGARAEAHAPRAGEDEHARVVVGLERVQAVAQAFGRGAVDRVTATGTIDGEDGRRADPLVAHLVGHGRTLVGLAATLHAKSRAPVTARRRPRPSKSRRDSFGSASLRGGAGIPDFHAQRHRKTH